MDKKAIFGFATTLALLVLMMSPLSGVRAAERTREKTWIRDMGVKCDVPDNLNPLIPSSAVSRFFGGIEEYSMEHLFYYNFLNGSLIPWLATSYNYTSDFKQTTIHLRQGIEWSDGTPLTSEDYVYTVNLLKANASLVDGTMANNWVKNVKSITATNGTTFTIEFNNPDPRFYWDIISNWYGPALIAVPKHIYSTQDPGTFKDSMAIRSGPYVLESASPELFVFHRNPNYWGAKTGFVSLPEPEWVVVTYTATPDASVMRSVKHELDFAVIGQGSSIELVKSLNPNATSWNDKPPYGATDPNSKAISVNNGRYPLSLPAVRWAISYALDRVNIVNTAFDKMSGGIEGMPWPTLAALQQYSFEDIVARYNTTEFNPEKSIALLEGLGFTRGDDGVFVTPNGTRLSFTLLVQTPETEFTAAAMIVKDDLKAVGIDIVLRPLDHATMKDLWYSRQYDLTLSWFGENKDPFYYYSMFHMKYVKPEGVMGWEKENPVGWVNKTFSDLVDQLALVRSDSTEAHPMLRALQEIFLQELPIIGYGNAFDYGVYDQKYWTGWPSKQNPYVFPQYIAPQWLLLMFRMKAVPTVVEPTSTQTGLPYETVAIIVVAAIAGAALVTYGVPRVIRGRKASLATKSTTSKALSKN